MSDILLNTASHDLLINEDGHLLITDTLSSAVAQRIKIRLLFFKGEWFLNTEFGTPYFQEIYNKGTTRDRIDTIFKNTISTTPGVIKLLEYSSEYEGSFRKLTINFKIQTTNGVESLTILLE